MLEMAESGPSELHAYAIDCLASLKAGTEECRLLRTELRLQVTGMSQVWSQSPPDVV